MDVIRRTQHKVRDEQSQAAIWDKVAKKTRNGSGGTGDRNGEESGCAHAQPINWHSTSSHEGKPQRWEAKEKTDAGGLVCKVEDLGINSDFSDGANRRPEKKGARGLPMRKNRDRRGVRSAGRQKSQGISYLRERSRKS